MSGVKVRDEDRSKVYAAEEQYRNLLKTPGVEVELAGFRMIIPDERKFGQVADIKAYVNKALMHVGCETPCAVRERKGHQWAMYHTMEKTIAIPDNLWALRESVVLHELAHHLVGGGQGHNAMFRSAHTNLVEQVMGPEARFILQHEYFQRGLSG